MRIDTGSSFGDFYPRSPCGERRSVHPETRRRDAISIHALLAESDGNTHGNTSFIQIFLSTLSLRRATVTVLGIQHRTGISIHALLAESDSSASDSLSDTSISIHALLAESDTFHQRSCIIKHNFYPRSPCGERHGHG